MSLRVRYFGDLHLEFTGMKPRTLPSIGEDLVVLAGDIAPGLAGVRWAARAIPDRPVVYVLGNHEFYGEDFDRLVEDARAECAGSHVHLLEHGAIDLQGFRILGCTLWTDLHLFGAERFGEAAADAAAHMADYAAIRRRGLRLAVPDTIDRCARSRAWLAEQIDAATRPVLVVTHHAPSLRTGNPRFEGQISNAAFHSAFDDLVRPPVRAWIHGHHHFSAIEAVNGIPLVTNQRGYPGEDVGPFSWDRCIEIGPAS